jgi:cytochrome c
VRSGRHGDGTAPALPGARAAGFSRGSRGSRGSRALLGLPAASAASAASVSPASPDSPAALTSPGRRPPLHTLLALLVLGTANAHAQAPQLDELLAQHHCTYCHAAQTPSLAPPFDRIAARYRHVPDAAARIEHTLRAGGPNHWGDLPMPPPEDRGGPLTAVEARVLAEWVLRQ